MCGWEGGKWGGRGGVHVQVPHHLSWINGSTPPPPADESMGADVCQRGTSAEINIVPSWSQTSNGPTASIHTHKYFLPSSIILLFTSQNLDVFVLNKSVTLPPTQSPPCIFNETLGCSCLMQGVTLFCNYSSLPRFQELQPQVYLIHNNPTDCMNHSKVFWFRVTVSERCRNVGPEFIFLFF